MGTNRNDGKNCVEKTLIFPVRKITYSDFALTCILCLVARYGCVMLHRQMFYACIIPAFVWVNGVIIDTNAMRFLLNKK